jgi:Kef-type K+ transport system membrane component KefB
VESLDIVPVNLMLVSAVAFVVPFTLGLFPSVRVPSAVVEIIAGILLGPAVLGWIDMDVVIEVMRWVGVAFLLFLAGMELDLKKLRGHPLLLGGVGFLVSFVLALGIESAFGAAGLVNTPLLVAIALSATSTGIVIPVLRDTGQLETSAGNYTVAGGAAAEFGTIVLLGLFFSTTGATPVLEAARLALIAVAAMLLLWGLTWFSRVEATRHVFGRLADSSSQVRVRLAVLVVIASAVFAVTLGFEAVLGTFIAGAIFAIVIDKWPDKESYSKKLDALGFGFFVPVFFISSGMLFDLSQVIGWFELGRVLVLFLVLLAVRGLPALLYRRHLTNRQVAASGLLQATNLSFIVVAVAVGEQLDAITVSGGEALIAAGLLSAIIFPPLATKLMGSGKPVGQ